MFSIHLYGRLQLFYQERPFTFTAPPKTLPLWVYLLLHRSQPVPRDILAFTLWPDVPEKTARANLRRHLHRLQKALPPPAPDKPWLLREAVALQWNTAADYWLDVAEFERLSSITDYLGKAVALYNGDLLPELDETWLLPHRERWRNQFFANLSRLVAHCHARRDLVQAIAYAQQALNHDPLREEMVRWLLRLYYESGDRAAALQLYRRFRQLLEEEFGVRPLAETAAVYQAILDNAPLPKIGRPAPVAVTPRHNLPAQLTPFFGRMLELIALQEMLTTPQTAARLLTLTGPGGSGKTRLALETAVRLLSDQPHHFPDGIFFVDLAAVTDSEGVFTAITAVLDLKEPSKQSLSEQLNNYLQSRYILLLLDNFEQVVAAAPQIAELLAAAPGLKVLVTSRIPLQVYGEHEIPVPPLPLPELAADRPESPTPAAAELLEYAAVSLFVARARAANSHFTLTEENAPLVAKICIRLDGLPLAIELAAARSKHYSLAGIRAGLSDSLSFLASRAGNVPARQQTIQATIEWSYNLLDVDEKLLFARLAVFKGSFSQEAVTAVTSLSESQVEGNVRQVFPQLNTPLPDLLASLVDKGMLQMSSLKSTETPRFWMLLTLKAYARKQLEASGELSDVYQQHIHYYLSLAEQAEQALKGPRQSLWLANTKIEYDNMRAALEWAITTPAENPSLGLRLAGALGLFWEIGGYWMEGYRWLKNALANSKNAPAPVQAKALLSAGILLHNQWRFKQAEPLLQQSLALYRELNDKDGIADALFGLGCLAFRQKAYREAANLVAQSLSSYRETNDQYGISMALRTLGDCTRLLKEYERASSLYEQALDLSRKIGNKRGIAAAVNSLGELARLQRDFRKAQTFYEEGLVLYQELGNEFNQAVALHNLGQAAVGLGDGLRAATLFRESLTLFQKIEYTRGIALCLSGLAGVAILLGQIRKTAALLGVVKVLLEASRAPLPMGPADQAAYDQYLATAKAQLDPVAFETAWKIGQQMTLDQAIATALEQ
jgi:predicted ATPase/DNA-binding SARP family transcriptional activator/uncharacterized protein HemY